MDSLIDFINSNASYAPFILFGTLCLAGFNVPVSEDALLLVAALLATQNPEALPSLFFAVYTGAYVSDLISYGLGRKLGPLIWKVRFFSKMLSRDRVEKIKGFYERYGMATLIVGRFIPFGVRNVLFITAGLTRMHFFKFALFDLIAATMTCTFFFTLYYTFGESIIDALKKGSLALFFTVLILGLFVLFLRKR